MIYAMVLNKTKGQSYPQKRVAKKFNCQKF